MTAALVLGLFFWEAVLRVTVTSPNAYVQHPELGWTPAPFSRSFNGTEGWAETRFNEWGLRDRQIEPKRPGEFRILCLGDSYTVSGATAEEYTFPRRLEALLSTNAARAALPGKPTSVRVINGGRVGINAVYSVGLAETYQRLFQPDWVVLQVRDYGETVFDPDHEFRYVRTGSGIEFHRRWHMEDMGRLKRFIMRIHAREFAVTTLGIKRLRSLTWKPSAAAEVGLVPATPAALQALAQTVGELRRCYPRLVLVHFPYGAPENADLQPIQPEETAWRLAARQNGVPLIPLRERIARDYARSHAPPLGLPNTLPWTGHPNEHGNQLATDALFDFFIHSNVGGLSPHGE